MAEPKNPFDFGTGSIDKDQWQRDIDNEQDAFIARYQNATNKKRGLLLRQAFQDLRKRIANGDMLNRTADGQYQFGSALLREDADMKEAYQRALGFMGDLARRQIQAPPAEPEKKKYSSKTLNDRFIRYFNPSGSQESFTSLWNSYDDTKRKQQLQGFLRSELSNLEKNYQDVEDYDSMDNLKTRINDFLSDPSLTNLNRLGFNRNYLSQLQTEEQQEEAPKSELEQANERLQAATEAQQVQQINQQIASLTAPSPTYQALLSPFNPSDYWNYDSFIRDINKRIEALKYTDENGNEFLKANSILRRTPTGNGHFTNQVTTRNTAWNGQAAKEARTYAQSQYAQEISSRLNNYFKNLGVNYQSILNNDKRGLMTNLAQLFTQDPDNKYVMEDVINNLFTRQQDGKFGLRGSTLSYDPSTHTLYNGNNIDAYKEGGILKGQNGLILDDSYFVKPANNAKKTEETSKQENSEEMDAGDWITILGTTAADIGSMLSANAVGAGTAASAGLGVASTLGNSVNDFRHGNVGSGLANLGIGLTTDLVGLIPGFGAGAKGYKIGRTLTRFARPLMAAFTANNFKEAGEVLSKGVRNGFGSLTAQDWTVLSAALTSMISRGKSAHTRQKNVEFINKASQHSSPTDTKGNITKHIINEKGFIKARKELLDQKRFGYNTSSKKYTKKVWNSIPEGGEIATPFYAKPFEWPKFGFGKAKKQKQVEEMEEFLKRNKEPGASPQGSGPEAPVVVPNENANGFYPLIKNGAKLKALRKGGIIKAKWGDDTSDWTTPQYNPESLKQEEKAIYTNPYFPNIQYNGTAPWYKSRFSGESVVNLGNDDSKRANLPGGLTGNNLDYAFARNQAYVKSGQQNKQADIQGYFDQLQSPIDANNLQGLTDIYNKAIDELYLPFTSGKNVPDYLKTDATKHNLLFRQVYGSRAKANEGDDNYDIGWNPDIIKTFGSASFARRPVNYETKWEDDLKNNLTQARDRVSKISHNGIEGYVYTDENGRIHPLTNNQLKLINGQQSPQKQDEGKEPSKVTDSEGSKETIFNTEYKNPIDPTLGIIAAKTAMGLAGNRNIYKNLLDEMPQAPLRDPIDRKLAIVGWQERIKNGQNQLADLRRVQQIQQGTDQQANFATALDVERIGRDIMDKSFQEDSGRQFETAQKSWNLDNEDTLYNAGVGDANRRAIADRARMMAQIRAAWRSGDNNIKMGAISDTGNWLLKKYQREQDIVDKAKELALGTPEEWAQSEYTSRLGDLANKKASDMTEMEKARVQEVKAQVLREMRQKYSQKYQSTFGTNLFGGGTKEVLAKDGAKLEVAKLKARSKDNDRYVSMMKDLRTTRYRRRRR